MPTTTHNLLDIHSAIGANDAQRPERFLALRQTTALVAELRCEASTTHATRELALAYLMWLSPAFAANVLRSCGLTPTAQSTTAEVASKVTGALAGIDLLPPGGRMTLTIEPHKVPTTRSHISNTGMRIGRRFTTSYSMRTSLMTIERLREAPAPAPVKPVAAPAPAPYRPHGWIDYDPSNEQHASWGSREAFEAAQMEALTAAIDQ